MKPEMQSCMCVWSLERLVCSICSRILKKKVILLVVEPVFSSEDSTVVCF